MTVSSSTITLVADIGGTNARLAIARDGVVDAGSIEKFSNVGFHSFEAVIGEYFNKNAVGKIEACCVAAAGPKVDGRIKVTNLDWVIDPVAIRKATSIKQVAVLNDLEALGYAVHRLRDDALFPVIRGSGKVPVDASKMVIGVGTGFNSAMIHKVDGKALVFAGESGHISLPVADDTGLSISKFTRHSSDFASVEDVLSGRGLEKLYAYVGSKHGEAKTASAAEICGSLKNKPDDLSLQAARLFAGFLGTVAGDLALANLAKGGIYLAGGVAGSLSPYLEKLGFSRSFQSKGRFSDHMKTYSVQYISNDYAALDGCAVYLRDRKVN